MSTTTMHALRIHERGASDAIVYEEATVPQPGIGDVLVQVEASSLTPTELRVVALVATGLTNPQIAERMFIARGTVKVHLGHVFAKLGVSTRAELAGQATKRGLAEN